MTRVKTGTVARQRHNKVYKKTKGYRHGRKNLIRQANQAVLKAGVFAYRDRRVKKRDFRRLWIVRINAALKPHDLTYSKFIAGLKKANIELDRKVLADLAQTQPEKFDEIVVAVKTAK